MRERTTTNLGSRILVALVCTTVALGACSSSGQSGDDESRNAADEMFATMMIPHHEQAITMSLLALAEVAEASSAVRVLAEQIQAAQDPEIDQMKAWLTEWGLEGGVAGDHSSMMQGMLSDAELADLATLRGSAFDAAWVAAMIAHHEGAIVMAEDVLLDGVHPGVRQMAKDIIAVQQAEIETLRRLLP